MIGLDLDSESRMTHALQIDNVRFTYPARRGQAARTAVDGISLSLAPGESLALLGPNGSGKSTLMRLITGMHPPDAGAITVFGATSIADRRARLGVVFQRPGLDPHLTVDENLRAQAAIVGLSSAERARRIEEELGADDLVGRRGDLVKNLSTGLARRVDLCRALLHEPPLLLLDEPTAGLDPVARESFIRRLERKQRDDGVSLFMSTHLTDEADRCDRVVLMHRGRIVAEGKPAALRAELGRRLITVLDAGDDPPTLDGVDWQRRSGTWQAPLARETDAPAIARALAEREVSFSITPPTLADVFEVKTGEALEPNANPAETADAH